MRGEDIQQHDLFSYGSLEQRVPADHPLRPIRTMVDEALKSLDGRFEEIYDRRPEVDTAGAFAAGIIAADALHGPQRADADGAARIQPAVLVVCWTIGQRAGLAP